MRSASSAVERYAKLAVRHGISLGALRSGNARDFAIVLGAAAQPFQPGRVFTEGELNDLLLTFLEEAGSMLATDHVELRRWLIDFRLLHRDGFGRAYSVGTPGPEFAAAAGELSSRPRPAQRKQSWERAR